MVKQRTALDKNRAHTQERTMKSMETQEKRFDQAVKQLCDPVANLLLFLPGYLKEQVQEVRLRAGQPLSLCSGSRSWFVDRSGKVYDRPNELCYRVEQGDLFASFRSLCSYSVHTHQNEIRQGFVTISGGHRAGICGTAVYEQNQKTGVRDITSINLRIARQIHGVADELVDQVFSKGLQGVLIAGAPSSGKTTLLRDLARQLSSGRAGACYKVAVVDERSEIAACSGGTVQNDLGPCCDVLDGFSKEEGIQMALRVLSPQVILCDEVGTQAEIQGVISGVNSGVAVVTTIHANSLQEILRRPQGRALLETGAFETLVILAGAKEPGKIRQLMPLSAHLWEKIPQMQ